MYPVEYKCTNADTVVTKINIAAVIESNISPIDTFNGPDSIHVHNLMYVGAPPLSPTS
jgi:hypothetical protein